MKRANRIQFIAAFVFVVLFLLAEPLVDKARGSANSNYSLLFSCLSSLVFGLIIAIPKIILKGSKKINRTYLFIELGIVAFGVACFSFIPFGDVMIHAACFIFGYFLIDVFKTVPDK